MCENKRAKKSMCRNSKFEMEGSDDVNVGSMDFNRTESNQIIILKDDETNKKRIMDSDSDGNSGDRNKDREQVGEEVYR